MTFLKVLLFCSNFLFNLDYQINYRSVAKYLTNGEIKRRRKKSAISALAGIYVFVINLTFLILKIITTKHTKNSKLKFMEVENENGRIYMMVGKQLEFAVTQMVEVALCPPAWATFKRSCYLVWQPILYLRQPFIRKKQY